MATIGSCSVILIKHMYRLVSTAIHQKCYHCDATIFYECSNVLDLNHILYNGAERFSVKLP